MEKRHKRKEAKGRFVEKDGRMEDERRGREMDKINDERKDEL